MGRRCGGSGRNDCTLMERAVRPSCRNTTLADTALAVDFMPRRPKAGPPLAVDAVCQLVRSLLGTRHKRSALASRFQAD